MYLKLASERLHRTLDVLRVLKSTSHKNDDDVNSFLILKSFFSRGGVHIILFNTKPKPMPLAFAKYDGIREIMSRELTSAHFVHKQTKHKSRIFYSAP